MDGGEDFRQSGIGLEDGEDGGAAAGHEGSGDSRGGEEAGFEMADIVRVQYTVVAPELVEALTPVLGNALGQIRPAATMVIAGLIRPEMKVEIEVTAFKG